MHSIDPAPRRYPDLVTLLRRADAGSNAVSKAVTPGQVRDWLLHDALQEDDFLLLLREFIPRLVAAGLQIDRVTVHAGTLHPQLLGFYWFWNSADGLIDELKVDIAGFEAPRYRRSPLAAVIERGETFRTSTQDPGLYHKYPLLGDLAAEGISEYCILPLSTGKAYHNAITLGTRRDAGFEEAVLAELNGILELFSFHVERQIWRAITENVLATYLGRAAGEKVMSGSIRRGTGDSIVAIVWMSDLRGFSALADRLPGADMLVLLNAYFEKLTDAVVAHGGEVLKFIGDGLLAVFPLDRENGDRSAARSALAAARQAQMELHRLNREPPKELQIIDGWRPLETGIALHCGEVFFGNVGGSERLDFTVIGRAVNEASRVEALTKELGRPILITEPVASLLEVELEPMGSHELRGVSGQTRIYAAPRLSEPG